MFLHFRSPLRACVPTVSLGRTTRAQGVMLKSRDCCLPPWKVSEVGGPVFSPSGTVPGSLMESGECWRVDTGPGVGWWWALAQALCQEGGMTGWESSSSHRANPSLSLCFTFPALTYHSQWAETLTITSSAAQVELRHFYYVLGKK